MAEIFDLCFMDCETTGLDEKTDEITEVAVVRMDARTMERKREFHRYVMPIKDPPEEVAKLNGFSRELWHRRGAQPIRDVLGGLASILEGGMPAGQNPGFDLRFIRAAFDAHQAKRDAGVEVIDARMPKMDYHVIDIAALAWPMWLMGIVPGVSLKHTAAYFGMGEQKHSAKDDVEMEIRVYAQIMKMHIRAIEEVAVEHGEVARAREEERIRRDAAILRDAQNRILLGV